jgi:hypothetical protein
MSRIRTIKPEFFTSESILALEPLARLFFISLWCEADREGRLAWKPQTLKYRYLPADKCDIDSLADSLIKQKLIEIYTIGDDTFCQVTGFDKHQVVNNRERESTIPKNTDASFTRESGVKAEGRKEGKGKEGMEGKEKGESFKKPSIEDIKNYMLEKNATNLLATKESEKMYHFYESKNWKVGNTKMSNWKSASTNWLNRIKEFSPEKPQEEKTINIDKIQEEFNKQRGIQ